MKRTTLLAIGATLLFATAGAASAQVTGQIDATITLESGCIINGVNNNADASNVDFGTVDFGLETTLFTQADAAVADTGQGITIQCTAGSAPVLTFGAGANDGNGSGGGNKAMQHASDSTQFVSYSLYSDAARADLIDSGHQITLESDGTEQTVDVFGRAFGAPGLIEGTYSDTVLVTLEL